MKSELRCRVARQIFTGSRQRSLRRDSLDSRILVSAAPAAVGTLLAIRRRSNLSQVPIDFCRRGCRVLALLNLSSPVIVQAHLRCLWFIHLARPSLFPTAAVATSDSADKASNPSEIAQSLPLRLARLEHRRSLREPERAQAASFFPVPFSPFRNRWSWRLPAAEHRSRQLSSHSAPQEVPAPTPRNRRHRKHIPQQAQIQVQISQFELRIRRLGIPPTEEPESHKGPTNNPYAEGRSMPGKALASSCICHRSRRFKRRSVALFSQLGKRTVQSMPTSRRLIIAGIVGSSGTRRWQSICDPMSLTSRPKHRPRYPSCWR